jgi:hypothetical protein
MLVSPLPRPSPATAYAAVNIVVLAWNLFTAGRIVNLGRGTTLFHALTALAALLAVPAIVVAAASSTILNGRAIYIIEWLWPFVLGVFALQALHALVRRRVSPFFGVPVALFDTMLFAAAAARFSSTVDPDLAAPVAALGVAHASVLAFVFGRDALVSPLFLQIPVLAPSYPAPYGGGRTLRIALTMWATVSLLLFAAEYPGAIHAAATFRAFAVERLQERPRGDLVIGVRILPALTGPPRALAMRDDLAVVDSLGAGAVSVVVRPPAGAGALALDSLARALEDERRDSTQLVVTLGYGGDDGPSFRHNPETYRRDRLRALDRIVRRLHPDLVLPALDPSVAGAEALGSVPAEWWRDYLRAAADQVHAASPGSRVGISASAFTPPDSALLSWAKAAPFIDVLGLSIAPSYGGGSSLVARLRESERWIRGAGKPVWVFATGAYPRLYGERNQAWALWGMLSWATAQREVAGFVVESAGDYDALTGLRAPGGRLRPALDLLVRARRTLAETKAGM